MDWLVDYEVRSSKRYRRFVALVLVASPDEQADLRRIFGDCVRRSDEFMVVNGYGAILMGETDLEGVKRAIERYQERCEGGDELYFSTAAFPRDGLTAEALFAKADERLQRARKGENGALVWRD